jgi:DNA-binding winged helix-turn-helix (wHTH) protein
MHEAVHRILRFDRFALDVTRGCLRCGEEEVALRPKAFEMLRYLAENSGRLVSKQELYQAVWPDVTVSDDSITQCIRELRDRLGDNDHSLIKTVSRRGYLLNAIVTTDIPDQVAVKRGAGARQQVGVLQRVVIALKAWRLACRHRRGRTHSPSIGLAESRARPCVRMRPAVGPFGKAFRRNSVCWMIFSNCGRTV